MKARYENCNGYMRVSNASIEDVLKVAVDGDKIYQFKDEYGSQPVFVVGKFKEPIKHGTHGTIEHSIIYAKNGDGFIFNSTNRRWVFVGISTNHTIRYEDKN